MVLKKLAAAVALTLVASVSQAGLIDLDGAGGAAAINVGAIDWGPTSFLALGGNTAIGNFVGTGGACPANSCSFDVLTQARLVATFAPNGTPNTPSGLNTTFEITMVGRFTETVIAATNGANPQATFRATPGSGFLQIYFDNAVNAVDVSGFDFSNGRLILNAGIANPAVGTFLETDLTQVPLDQHGANDYTGQTTASGTGSEGNLNFNVTGQDSTFFIDPLATMGLQIANVSIGLPFISVDPADCFNANAAFGGAIGTNNVSVCNAAHVNGLLNPATQPGPGVIPNVGQNGVFGTGPDFIAQTDFNSPLTFAAVPEPASMALLGVGLLGMAFARRRNLGDKS